MKAIWKLFVGDVKRLTSNVVSVIIVIGLTVLPALFTWFNVAASWDPFSNTGNLKFAVANVDAGYKSDLIPVKINVGDQVVNTLRANSQLDWTFTSKEEAIDGTKSGKYYAAVIIPKDFSKRMMTFFSKDSKHAELTYYNNEKKNALAPKVTGQGADTVSAEINEMFSKTLTETALDLATQLSDQLDKPEAKNQLQQFSSNISDFAAGLTQTASSLKTFSSLTGSAQTLLDSSGTLIQQAASSAKTAGKQLKSASGSVTDLSGALNTSTEALSTAIKQSGESFAAVGDEVDSLFANVSTQAGDTATALRNQASNVTNQTAQYQHIVDDLQKTHDDLQNKLDTDTSLTDLEKKTLTAIIGKFEASISKLNNAIDMQKTLAATLTDAAQHIDDGISDSKESQAAIKDLATQAKASINAVHSDFDTNLKPQLNEIGSSVNTASSALNASAANLKSALGDLNKTTSSADKQLTTIREVLDSTADSLTTAGNKLSTFNATLSDALNSGDMSMVKDVLGKNTDSLATTLAAPVKVKRTAVFPVKNFGSQLAPLYTFVTLWVGSLLMAVTLKTSVSRKTRMALGNPKPHQLFFGHYLVFAVIALMQATFSLGGSLLFMHVQAVHPWLFMVSGWISALIHSFFAYTMVASFGNVGKAIGVLFLIMQISGSNGAYPLAVMPRIISDISPFLPVTHSVTAMRAAIAGIYNNDFWTSIGALALFIPPLLLIGLLLRIPMMKFNKWYIAKVESTKVIM